MNSPVCTVCKKPIAADSGLFLVGEDGKLAQSPYLHIACSMQRLEQGTYYAKDGWRDDSTWREYRFGAGAAAACPIFLSKRP